MYFTRSGGTIKVGVIPLYPDAIKYHMAEILMVGA